MYNKKEQTQVVIIGGGITDLMAGLLLQRQNIDFIIIEKHTGTSIQPRARTIDVRTMQIFRELELNHAVRNGGKDLGPAWGILRGKNLLEQLEKRAYSNLVQNNFRTAIGRSASQHLSEEKAEQIQKLLKESPEDGCRCTQDISEIIIYNALKNENADVRFYQKVIDFTQDEDAVYVQVLDRNTGEKYSISAQYMIAADGAGSPIREKLQLTCSEHKTWMDLLNVYIDADLEEYVKGKEFSQFIINEPDLKGFILAINNKNKWAFHLKYYPEKGESPNEYTTEKLTKIFQKVVGFSDLKVQILSVLPWKLNIRIVEKISVGRIFLVGDAIHTMTPYAGKGANAGVQDVHNLAWKLALVLRNISNEKLLESYQEERQPIGAFYTKLSQEMTDDNGFINDLLLAKNGLTLMGLPDYQYNSNILSESIKTNRFFEGEIGTVLPHIWIDENQTISTLDWVKNDFVLIAIVSSVFWEEICQLVKKKYGLNINYHFFKNNWIQNDWIEKTNSFGNESFLIRPDGFVCAKFSMNNSKEKILEKIAIAIAH